MKKVLLKFLKIWIKILKYFKKIYINKRKKLFSKSINLINKAISQYYQLNKAQIIYLEMIQFLMMKTQEV